MTINTVAELQEALRGLNPDAEVYIALTDQEEDMLPIAGIQMKIPLDGVPAGKTEREAALKVALRIFSRANEPEKVDTAGSAGIEILRRELEKMQQELKSLTESFNQDLNEEPEKNGN